MFKSKARQIILAVAVVGLLIFLHWLGVLKPMEVIMNRGINPVMSLVYKTSSFIRIKYGEQTSKINLQEKVNELEEEVNKLMVKNAELSGLEAENKALREHLNFLSVKKYHYVMSNVISRTDLSDIGDRTETIIIDKGLIDGLYAGLPVLDSEGAVVGKIAEVKEDLAKVFLVNNKNCKLAATILNQQKTNGIAEGELGLTIKMNFIPQTENIKNGDIIVTSGLEKSIPRGLVIGKVSQINKESNELWQNATIEPMFDPNELIIVSVLLPLL